MKKQIDYYKEAPDAFKAMFEMEKFIKEIPLDSKLKELVKIRTSQINGCAYCVNEHSKEALEMGETIQRVISLVVWKECTFYSRQEQAALNLVEHIVEVADKRIPDDVYQEISKYFTDQEYVYLVFCINQMNAWNRIAISMGKHADSMEL
ncbi:MAG: carboxymuconolactone decarboxylase family protein [Erysipelothrix sp.]